MENKPEEMPELIEFYKRYQKFPSTLVSTFVRESPKVGRNEPCPCGSDKKFKKCCGGVNAQH